MWRSRRIFWFDTIYAMADVKDDKELGLNSSAITLGEKSKQAVAVCYCLSCLFLAFAAIYAGISYYFWPFWISVLIGMQKETWTINQKDKSSNKYSRHFKRQVYLGSLLCLGLIIGRIN